MGGQAHGHAPVGLPPEGPPDFQHEQPSEHSSCGCAEERAGDMGCRRPFPSLDLTHWHSNSSIWCRWCNKGKGKGTAEDCTTEGCSSSSEEEDCTAEEKGGSACKKDRC